MTLADPTRRRILGELRSGPSTVNDLVSRLEISQPALSRHLKVLREAELVVVRPDGQRRWYGLNAQPLAEVAEWLEPFRRFWSDELDALERHLDEEAQP